MKAFVYKVGTNGTDLGTGRVSPPYTHFGNFMRHWMSKLPPGTYRAYIYTDWARRYREADAVKTITVGERNTP